MFLRIRLDIHVLCGRNGINHYQLKVYKVTALSPGSSDEIKSIVMKTEEQKQMQIEIQKVSNLARNSGIKTLLIKYLTSLFYFCYILTTKSNAFKSILRC